MADPQPLLAPVIALVVWTVVMWAWMYATRIPAILRMRMKLDGNAPRGEQMATLPARVRWKADNYNHLFEQPVLFYATAISLARDNNLDMLFFGLDDESNIGRAVAGERIGTWVHA